MTGATSLMFVTSIVKSFVTVVFPSLRDSVIKYCCFCSKSGCSLKESSFEVDKLKKLASVPEIVKVNSSSSTSETDIVTIWRVFSGVDIVDAILISGSS